MELVPFKPAVKGQEYKERTQADHPLKSKGCNQHIGPFILGEILETGNHCVEIMFHQKAEKSGYHTDFHRIFLVFLIRPGK